MDKKSLPVLGGKCIASLFFLIFAAAGLFFLALTTHSFFLELAVSDWEKKPCRIVSSAIMEMEQEYRLIIDYRYPAGRGEHSGNRIYRTKNVSGPWSEMEKLKKQLDQQQSCLVNPRNKTEAVLLQLSPYSWGKLLGVLLPLVFIATGFGGIFFIWKRAPVRRNTPPKQPNPLFLPALLGLFGVVGICLLLFWGIPVLKRAISAQNWHETPCKIINAKVLTHSGDDGDTYSVDVLYRYTFHGRSYTGDAYSLGCGSSSGYHAKKKVVAALRKNRDRFCYVNPADPSESVLSRDWLVAGVIAPLIFSVVFAGIGIFGNLAFWRKYRRKKKLNGRYDYEKIQAKFNRPKRKSSRGLGAFFGTLLIALFWNGIVSLFVTDAVQGHLNGAPDWVLTVFMVPFVLIGLVLIGAVLHAFLALFNPYPEISVEPDIVSPGDKIKIAWRFEQPPERIDKLKITLVCQKQDTHRDSRGKSRIQTIKLHEIPVREISHSGSMFSGWAQAAIPPDAPITQTGEYPNYSWLVQFSGEIRRYPDMKAQLEFAVVPPR